jgi:RNA polymerase sigma-70 factor (ECF subfamily)
MALDELSEKQREAFVLSKYQDLGNPEIADVMGLSVSAVESLVHRAKLKLKEVLVRVCE